MQVLVNLIQWLFSRKKTVVSITFRPDAYLRVTSRLKSAGIPYRTVFMTMNTPPGAGGGTHNGEYKIYVKKEDEHLAHKAIHRQ
ncbi:MAG TPA: hypothetical protein VFT51_14165 [Bacillales bacterium]|nr:hypothetical protein [Bacillales bacterium]